MSRPIPGRGSGELNLQPPIALLCAHVLLAITVLIMLTESHKFSAATAQEL